MSVDRDLVEGLLELRDEIGLGATACARLDAKVAAIHQALDDARIAKDGLLGHRVGLALRRLHVTEVVARDALAARVTLEDACNTMGAEIEALRRERDEAIKARNAAWREAADLRVALNKVRAQRDRGAP